MADKSYKVTPVFDPTLFGLLPTKSNTLIPEEAKEALSQEQLKVLENPTKENISTILFLLGVVGSMFNPAAGVGLLGSGLAVGRGSKSEKKNIIQNAIDTVKSRAASQEAARKAGLEERGVAVQEGRLGLEAEKLIGEQELSNRITPQSILEKFGVAPKEGELPLPLSELTKLAPSLKEKEVSPSSLGKLHSERDSIISQREAYINSKVPGETLGVKGKDPILDSFDKKISSYDDAIGKESKGEEKAGGGLKIGSNKEEILKIIREKGGVQFLDEGDKQALEVILKSDKDTVSAVIALATKDINFEVASPEGKVELLQYYVDIINALQSPSGSLKDIKKPQEKEESKGIFEIIKEKVLGSPSEEPTTSNAPLTDDLISKLPNAAEYFKEQGDKIVVHKKSGRRFQTDGSTWKEIK